MYRGAATRLPSWRSSAAWARGQVLVTNPRPTANATSGVKWVSKTARAKFRRQEGNSPDQRLRAPKRTQLARPSSCSNSQDVGSEAAIISRVRNSSLVECGGTDNPTRIKSAPEALNPISGWDGRGAFWHLLRSGTVRTRGAARSANAGMSSVWSVQTRPTASLRVPEHRQSSQGESGPKPRLVFQVASDGKQVKIPAPERHGPQGPPDVGTRKGPGSQRMDRLGVCAEVRMGGKSPVQARNGVGRAFPIRESGSPLTPPPRKATRGCAASARTANRHR